MKKFIGTLALFSILFFAFDKMFLLIRDQAPEREVDRRLENLLEGRINQDIIVLGSSRGARDILAERIEDSTGLTSYNLSYPGSDVTFHLFLLETLLQYSDTPKVILLTVDDPAQLLEDRSINFRLDRLYPLVKYPYIRQELIKRGEKNKLLSAAFILHQLNESSFLLRDKKFTTLDSITDHGSMPISFHDENPNWRYIDADTAYHVDKELPEKLSAFNQIITLCKQNDIDLILVLPPNYRTLNTAFLSRMVELAGKDAGVMYYDDKRTEYRDLMYYYDPSHLKRNGAEIFTDDLIAYLRDR